MNKGYAEEFGASREICTSGLQRSRKELKTDDRGTENAVCNLQVVEKHVNGVMHMLFPGISGTFPPKGLRYIMNTVAE